MDAKKNEKKALMQDIQVSIDLIKAGKGIEHAKAFQRLKSRYSKLKTLTKGSESK
jgi:hypothetical protein